MEDVINGLRKVTAGDIDAIGSLPFDTSVFSNVPVERTQGRKKMSQLRKKLSEATMGDNYIETVWGRGYVLRDPEPVEQREKIAVGA